MWSHKNAIMVFQPGATFLYFREVLLYKPRHETQSSSQVGCDVSHHFSVTVHGDDDFSLFVISSLFLTTHNSQLTTLLAIPGAANRQSWARI